MRNAATLLGVLGCLALACCDRPAAQAPVEPEAPPSGPPYLRRADLCRCPETKGGVGRCRCNHCVGLQPGVARCYCGTGGCECGSRKGRCDCGHCTGRESASQCNCR